MKFTKIFLSIILSSVMMGCSGSFLDQANPNEKTTTDFWKSESDLMEGINAAYRPLRFNGAYSRWLHVLYISRSDEGYSQSPNSYFVSYSNFKPINDDNSEGIFYPWLDMYKGVFWANQVIDNAPGIAMDESLKSRIMGEAYFIRGVHLFNIGGVFGRGPLTLSSLADAKSDIVEQADFYEQARKDFQEAENRLPAFYEKDADVGRATKGSAMGMLAKVYAQQHLWQKVSDMCDSIYALKGASGTPLYKLVSNYKDNFTATNENNSESLFEVQFAYGTQSGIDLGCQRAKFLGLPVDGVSWDDATPNPILKTDLEQEKTIDNQVDPRLKCTLFYFDSSNPNEQFYGKTWTQWGLNKSKVYWKKYNNYDTQTYEDYNSGINFRLVRLADIYLLHAEALNELGRTSEAYPYIDKVRARVNMPALENSTVFTGIGNDQQKMRDQIMHERVCELTGECWRWLDLERWGCFESAEKISWLKTRDSEFDNFVIGKSNRYPIPYREISLIKGLVQNPGY